MGQKPTEEELFQMISEVDENMSGSIDLHSLGEELSNVESTFASNSVLTTPYQMFCRAQLKVIENQKERAENFDDENDMIDAFVACGTCVIVYQFFCVHEITPKTLFFGGSPFCRRAIYWHSRLTENFCLSDALTQVDSK